MVRMRVRPWLRQWDEKEGCDEDIDEEDVDNENMIMETKTRV